MSKRVQFDGAVGEFSGLAPWPRRYSTATPGRWIKTRLSELGKSLSSSGWDLQTDGESERRHELTLVDTFDWRLAQRGHLRLIVDGNETIQIPIRKRVDEQAVPFDSSGRVQRPIATPADLSVEENRAVRPRAILDYGSAAAIERVTPIRNGNDKTVALIQSVTLVTGKRRLEFARVAPLRGFTRFAPRIDGDPIDAGVAIAKFVAAETGRRPFDYETGLRLPLKQGQTVGDVNAIVCAHLTRVCRNNIDGISRRIDVEHLHDFRVAVRRLRSYLKAVPHLPDPALTANLRGFWNATGQGRDLDVFLSRERHYLKRAPRSIVDEVHAMFGQLESWRDDAYRALIVRFDRGEFEALESSISDLRLTSPEKSAASLAMTRHQVASKSLKRSVERLLRAYNARGEDIADNRIHDTRIKAKKLRYITEIFAPLLNGETQVVKGTRRLQNRLGEYNDLVVEERLFMGILDQRPHELEPFRAGVAYMLAQVEREKSAARHLVMVELGRKLS